jgi:hypothetical protein
MPHFLFYFFTTQAPSNGRCQVLEEVNSTFHVFRATNNSPHPALYASNSITFQLPAFNGIVNVLLPGVVPVVGKKATTYVTPLTTTFAYL